MGRTRSVKAQDATREQHHHRRESSLAYISSDASSTSLTLSASSSSHAIPTSILPFSSIQNAAIHFYISRGYFQDAIDYIVTLEQRESHSFDATILLKFWKSFAYYNLKQYPTVIEILSPIEKDESYALPITALLISTHTAMQSSKSTILNPYKKSFKSLSKTANTTAKLLLVYFLYFIQKWNKVQKFLTKILSNDKSNSLAWNLFGFYYSNLQNREWSPKMALNCFRKAYKAFSKTSINSNENSTKLNGIDHLCLLGRCDLFSRNCMYEKLQLECDQWKKLLLKASPTNTPKPIFISYYNFSILFYLQQSKEDSSNFYKTDTLLGYLSSSQGTHQNSPVSSDVFSYCEHFIYISTNPKEYIKQWKEIRRSLFNSLAQCDSDHLLQQYGEMLLYYSRKSKLLLEESIKLLEICPKVTDIKDEAKENMELEILPRLRTQLNLGYAAFYLNNLELAKEIFSTNSTFLKPRSTQMKTLLTTDSKMIGNERFTLELQANSEIVWQFAVGLYEVAYEIKDKKCMQESKVILTALMDSSNSADSGYPHNIPSLWKSYYQILQAVSEDQYDVAIKFTEKCIVTMTLEIETWRDQSQHIKDVSNLSNDLNSILYTSVDLRYFSTFSPIFLCHFLEKSSKLMIKQGSLIQIPVLYSFQSFLDLVISTVLIPLEFVNLIKVQLLILLNNKTEAVTSLEAYSKLHSTPKGPILSDHPYSNDLFSQLRTTVAKWKSDEDNSRKQLEEMQRKRNLQEALEAEEERKRFEKAQIQASWMEEQLLDAEIEQNEKKESHEFDIEDEPDANPQTKIIEASASSTISMLTTEPVLTKINSSTPKSTISIKPTYESKPSTTSVPLTPTSSQISVLSKSIPSLPNLDIHSTSPSFSPRHLRPTEDNEETERMFRVMQRIKTNKEIDRSRLKEFSTIDDSDDEISVIALDDYNDTCVQDDDIHKEEPNQRKIHNTGNQTEKTQIGTSEADSKPTVAITKTGSEILQAVTKPFPPADEDESEIAEESDESTDGNNSKSSNSISDAVENYERQLHRHIALLSTFSSTPFPSNKILVSNPTLSDNPTTNVSKVHDAQLPKNSSVPGDKKDPDIHKSNSIPISIPTITTTELPSYRVANILFTPSGSPTSASAAATAAAPTPRSPATTTPTGRSPETLELMAMKQRMMLAGQQIEAAKAFCKQAYWGENFIKHGRRGTPHARNVSIEVDGSVLCFDWTSGKLRIHKDDITILLGKQTEVFQRKVNAKAREELCFSIVTQQRTLDLEARNMKIKDYWLNGLNLLIKYLK